MSLNPGADLDAPGRAVRSPAGRGDGRDRLAFPPVPEAAIGQTLIVFAGGPEIVVDQPFEEVSRVLR